MHLHNWFQKSKGPIRAKYITHDVSQPGYGRGLDSGTAHFLQHQIGQRDNSPPTVIELCLAARVARQTNPKINNE